MSSIAQQDRRLRQRGRPDAASAAEAEAELLKLPDAAENVRQPEEAELEKLSEELRREAEIRTERLQRAIARAAEPPPPPRRGPVEPLEESEI